MKPWTYWEVVGPWWNQYYSKMIVFKYNYKSIPKASNREYCQNHWIILPGIIQNELYDCKVIIVKPYSTPKSPIQLYKEQMSCVSHGYLLGDNRHLISIFYDFHFLVINVIMIIIISIILIPY